MRNRLIQPIITRQLFKCIIRLKTVTSDGIKMQAISAAPGGKYTTATGLDMVYFFQRLSRCVLGWGLFVSFGLTARGVLAGGAVVLVPVGDPQYLSRGAALSG